MEEIAKNIYIETTYPGVVIAALRLNQGMLLVDAPFRVEDSQAWQDQLVYLKGGSKRYLIMLDTHIDRTLGIHTMGTPVLGHENAAEILRARSTTARGQDSEAGADWEPYELPTSIRWAELDLSYEKEMLIYWDEAPVIVSHQPGAHLAGSWVRCETEKIVFVGDSVVLEQPPFLAWSDLDRWLAELDWLSSDQFKDYKIVSGRNGIITAKDVQEMADYLRQIQSAVTDLAESDHLNEAIAAAAPDLLEKLTFNQDLRELFQNRLVWGLQQYIRRHHTETHTESLGD